MILVGKVIWWMKRLKYENVFKNIKGKGSL